MFSTGYVANVSTISGLLNRHDYVVLDKDAHNSLLTGANLSGATMKRFGHNDLVTPHQDPRRAPRRSRARPSSSTASTRWAATPRRWPRWSSCAGGTPTRSCSTTRRTVSACSARAGRGAAEHHGVLADVDLITITFSKTLGSCGGALIGSADAIELLMLDADPLIFTASNTPGSIAAALEALRVLRDEPEIVGQLRGNVELFVRPAHRARRAGQPGRERDHHHPAPSARRGVGGRARPRAARGRGVREPGGGTGGARRASVSSA